MTSNPSPVGRRIAKANANNATLQLLLQADDQHSSWVAVVAFYKALHLVEAVFETDKAGHARSHESRERLLKTTTRYNNIYKHYRPLAAAATVARYLALSSKEFESFGDYMPAEVVERLIVGHHLRQLEKSVLKIVGPECGLRQAG